MTKLSCLAFLCSLFILSCFIPPASCDDTPELIDQICNLAQNLGFCYQILKASPPPPPGGIVGLTSMTVTASVKYAEETLTAIQKIKPFVRDPKLQQLYTGCEANYNEALGFINGAKNAFDHSDYKTMRSLYQQSSRPMSLCQTAIGKVVELMRVRNEQVITLIGMAIYESSYLT